MIFGSQKLFHLGFDALELVFPLALFIAVDLSFVGYHIVLTIGFFTCRSSVHGKGLNRFWSNVEGYHGPILILISASSVDASLSERSTKRWVIGVLTEQGFENRETFYGNYGFLYAISPVFRVLSSSGTS